LCGFVAVLEGVVIEVSWPLPTGTVRLENEILSNGPTLNGGSRNLALLLNLKNIFSPKFGNPGSQ
jgi:hypothetical protein